MAPRLDSLDWLRLRAYQSRQWHAARTNSLPPQQTRDIKLMLGLCWADVVDGGPTSTQHWFNVSCLLGRSGRDTPACLMLGQRLRRWPNNKPTLVQTPVRDYGITSFTNIYIRFINPLNAVYYITRTERDDGQVRHMPPQERSYCERQVIWYSQTLFNAPLGISISIILLLTRNCIALPAYNE